MHKSKVIIATRKSPLALWQANFIKNQLQKLHPQIAFDLLGLTTQGDIHLATPLYTLGGKGLFVKELEQALLDGRADIAVHSLKDMPAELPQGLTIAVICQREDPRDVFIANHYESISELPYGSEVGTSSLRRQCQIKTLRPDLKLKPLRGNVDTRLNKLDNEEFAAIILAAAGIKRLGYEKRIKMYFSPENFIPAVAQGALGIECRINDRDILEIIQPLDDAETRTCVTAEQAVNFTLGGGCQVPVAAHAIIANEALNISGLVGKPDGSIQIRRSLQGKISEAEQLGKRLAQELLANGADKILKEVLDTHGK